MLNYFVKVNMPTTKGRKKSKNFYPGCNICNSIIGNKYMYRWQNIDNKVGNDVVVLDSIYKTIENDDNVILKKGSLHCIVKEDDRVEFNETWDSEICFSKKDFVAEEIKDIDNFISIKFVDTTSVGEIFQYISKVASLNENVWNFFMDNSDSFTGNLETWSENVSDQLQSIVYNISYAFFGIEKMFNAGQEKLLLKNLKYRSFKLKTDSKKLSKSVGLPSFALPIIKKLRLEASIDALSSISANVDGNSLKLLLEFVENYSKFTTANRLGSSAVRDRMFSQFFESLSSLIENGYKMQDVINYLLRQRMYWNKLKPIGFPFEEMELYLDYINLNSENSLKFEKYPQNLWKMHDILVINLKDYDESKDDDFKEATAKYSKYEAEYKKDGYCFIVPENIKALMQEGNVLHHCIGSYVDKIINGSSKIIFMRAISDKNTPFVTIEIDDKCNITEIKGALNQEPDTKIIAIANKWAGACKRIK